MTTIRQHVERALEHLELDEPQEYSAVTELRHAVDLFKEIDRLNEEIVALNADLNLKMKEFSVPFFGEHHTKAAVEDG